MSNVAGLFNVPATPEQFAEWSSNHMNHHRDIIRVIYDVLHIALPEYLIDPFDPANPGNWSDLHQTMHNQMDLILGIKGFNLEDPPWDNQGALASWTALHSEEHRQAADILEIG